MRPLVVYLDTSDIIQMYNSTPGSRARDVFETLSKRVGAGEVVVAISYVHFFEFIQKAQPGFRDERYARVDFLADLTRDWSFPFYMDLKDDSVVRQGPHWMPRESLEGFEIEKLVTDLHQRLCAAIDMFGLGSISKKDRRKIKTRNGFIRFVRSRPDVLSSVNENADRGIYENFFRSGVLRKYILGQLGRHEANSILGRSISLRAVYRFYFEIADGKNPITDGGKPLKQSWDAQFRKLEDALKSARDLLGQSELLSKRASELARAPHRDVAYVGKDLKILTRERISEIKRFLKSPVDFSGYSLVDSDHASLVNDQFNANASAFVNSTVQKQAMDFSQSDIGDILHSLYLPFCDLWRGDRRFSSVLRIADVPFSRRIVSNLLDLPQRIDLLLAG